MSNVKKLVTITFEVWDNADEYDADIQTALEACDWASITGATINIEEI